MTVEEFKIEAAKLPPGERFELAEWIGQGKDIREMRRAALIREIETGLDQVARGECVECKDDAELRSFFDGVKARGRTLLSASKASAARVFTALRERRSATSTKFGATSAHSTLALLTAGSTRSSGDSELSRSSRRRGKHAPISPRTCDFYRSATSSFSTGPWKAV